MSLVEQLEHAVQIPDLPPERQMARSGLTLARIVNVTDPDKLNRVKCLPVGMPDAEETDWCYFMSPMGGKGCGVYFPPRVGDLAVLGYLDDDPHRPVVMGSIWNTELPPPYTIQDGKVEDYAIRTPKEVDLSIHDEDKKQTVTLTMPSGVQLKVDDEKKVAFLQDKGGKNALTFDFDKGEATLCCEKKITFSAGDSSITLESSGDITLKCSGSMTLKCGSKLSMSGVQIAGKANDQVQLQGMNVAVKGDCTMEVSSGGSTTVKGGIVKIN